MDPKTLTSETQAQPLPMLNIWLSFPAYFKTVDGSEATILACYNEAFVGVVMMHSDWIIAGRWNQRGRYLGTKGRKLTNCAWDLTTPRSEAEAFFKALSETHEDSQSCGH